MARMQDADYRAVLDTLHHLCAWLADKDDHPGWCAKAIIATALTGMLEVTEANATHVLHDADWSSVLNFFTEKPRVCAACGGEGGNISTGAVCQACFGKGTI